MAEQSLEEAQRYFFIALGIDMAVTAVSVASDFWAIDVLKTIAASGSTGSQSDFAYMEFWEKFAVVMVLTTVGVGWTLTRWVGACYVHARQTLGATGFHHEKWKTTGWIFPFLNLFKPYQVLSEIYRVGASSGTQSDDWKKTSGSGVLLTWWVFWIISHLVMMSVFKAAVRKPTPESPTLTQVFDAYYIAITFSVLSLIIAGLWFVVAGNLTKRLLERSDRPFKPVPLANNAVHAAPASNDAYAAALAEIEEGRLDKGVWARSFADSAGDESKAKAAYIKARAESLKGAAVWANTQPPTQDVPAVGVSPPPAGAPPSPLWWLAGIAVIGIVAAMALPAYQNYTKRQTVAASAVQAPAQQPDLIYTPPTFGANDKIVSGPYEVNKRAWSGNPFDKFDSVDDIAVRARQFPQLNEPRAWAAVLAWQASNMRVDKNPANEALHNAVGTVLAGMKDNRGVCRPGQVDIVSAAQASDSMPAGTPLTRLDCDR